MDSFFNANPSRLRQGIPSRSEIICVISHENISNDQKRMKIRSLTEEQNEQIVGSCLFSKSEVLDYRLIPSFPNYLYAFTSLLVPTVISWKRCDGIIRLTVCVLCTLLALFLKLMELRQSFDACMENTELYNYVDLLNAALAVLTSGQVLNILLRRRKLLLRTFRHPTSSEYVNNRKILTYDPNTRKTFWVAGAFIYAFLAIDLFRLGSAGFDDGKDWTLWGILETNADYLREVIRTAPISDETNSTISTNSFLNVSAETHRMEIALLGFVGYALQLATFLTSDIIHGFFLFSALTMKEVADKLDSLLNVHSPDGKTIKHIYEFMFRSTVSLNLSIGGLLATHHIQIFLDFVLVLRIVLAEGGAIHLSTMAVWVLPEVTITVAAYYYATQIPVKVDAFRSWIRNRENQESLRIDAITIQNLFDELNTNPSGIGTGIFYVNAELLSKLLSSIGTYFLVIATRTD